MNSTKLNSPLALHRFWLVVMLGIWGTLPKVHAQQSNDPNIIAYIERYQSWAVSEQQRTGVPAAITLAQGIHETAAGESELCINANNHFGIKCKKNWEGKTYTYTDDAKDECFRKYDDARSSYKDHSDFLRNNVRYASLFNLEIEDYRGWCHGLKQCGYATNPQYAPKLIKLIEDYNLHQFTLLALKDKGQPERIPEHDNAIAGSGGGSSEKGQIVIINNLRAVFCKKGTALLDVAMEHDMRYAKLLEINDLPDAPVPFDMYVYLQRKPTKGIRSMHHVKAGETMLHVAQSEGVQLQSILAYNNMALGEEPLAGSELYLQEPSTIKPILTQTKRPDGVPAEVQDKEAYIMLNKSEVAPKPSTTPLVKNTEITATTEEVKVVTTPANTSAPVQENVSVTSTNTIEKPAPTTTTTIKETEPADELERLKRKLDKIVYTDKNVIVTEEKPQEKEAPDDHANTPQPQQQQPAASPKPQIHVVKKGETAYGIAKKYGVTMKELMKWNNLDFQELKVGQKLKLQP